MILSLVFLLMLLCSLGVAWWYEHYYQRLSLLPTETARIHAMREDASVDSTVFRYEICLFEQPGSPIEPLLCSGSFRPRWPLGETITVVHLHGKGYALQAELWQLRIGIVIALLIAGVFGWLANLNWDEMLQGIN